MTKHINFCGFSLWTSDDIRQGANEELSAQKSFYSPGVLATYCIFIDLLVGFILYGINISRRGYLWKGKLLIILSILILVIRVFVSLLMPNQLLTLKSQFLLTVPIALNLYILEKHHFQRAIRHGSKQARWWLPLIWVAVIVGTIFLLLKML